MSSRILNSALKLSDSQKIILVEQIWDSIAKNQTAPDITLAQESELDHRLNRLKKSGPTGSSWEDVKKRLKKRKR